MCTTQIDTKQGTMRMTTKTEILRKYRDEVKKILSIEFNKDEFVNIIEFIEHKEELEFNLASSYLTKYPCLNDYNCSGRGLPQHTVNKRHQ